MVQCDWNNPGASPARGLDIPTMISSYGYPKSDQAVLVEKIRTANNDGVVVITKNGLVGLNGTATNLADMHFRNGKCEGLVNTSKWPTDKQEKALVYCSNNNCVAIPVICGNISRITWQRKEKSTVIDQEPKSSRALPEPSSLLLTAIGILALVRFMPR